jgi:TetR/AcrR family transcriptional regulator, regulator of cefoperazone and chloramphenicol sensitivity
MTSVLSAPPDSTRQRITCAALDCILERGFYRASSNEIARRAGMTWGAIQYYFGTRERLMLAALEVSDREFEQLLQTADIGVGTTAQRLEKLADLLTRQYSRPRYLATLQIVLNLAHNPQTSAETAAALIDVDRRLSSQLVSLIRLAVGPKADEEMVTLVFHALRGLAVSHLIHAETSPAELAGVRRPGNLAADSRLLAIALGRLIDGEVS